MKKLTQLLLSVIVLFTILISCNYYIPQTPYSYLDGTWHGLFEGYWNGMNNNYAFWSLDSPSNEWDLKYEIYSAKFKALGKLENATSNTSQMAAKLFMDMNKDLTDGHFALIMKFPNIKTTLFQPSEYQKAKNSSKYTDDATLFKAIFEYYNNETNNDLSNYLPEDLKHEKTLTIIEKTFGFKIDTETKEEDKKIRNCSNSLVNALSSTNYTQSTKDTTTLDSYFKEWMIFNEKGDNSLMCLLGLTKGTNEIPENTIYIAFDGFNFYPFLEDLNLIALVDQFRAYKQDSTTKGMIVDLRGNTGGYNVDRDILFSDLVEDKKQFAWYRSKTGDNRLDYTPYLPVYLYQYVDPEEKPFTASPVANKPIAVLTNTASLSNSEVTTLLLKTFEKGVSIGGTTSGGFGCLSGTIDVSNSGEFRIDNYLTVYTPNQQIVSLDKTSYEGIGITPDYPVEFKLDEFNSGTDERLKDAFKYVSGNK